MQTNLFVPEACLDWLVVTLQVIDYYRSKTVKIAADKSTAEVANQIRQSM